MYLRIYPNGSKYWQLQYWFKGRQKILSLGVWPEVSLKLAREKRYEAKKKLKEGKKSEGIKFDKEFKLAYKKCKL